MSARRCPTCGGLVGPDAEWCGQCLTRLTDRPAEAQPAAVASEREEPGSESAELHPAVPGARAASDGRANGGPRGDGRASTSESSGSRVVRSTPDGIVWDCPTCDQTNPIDTLTCTVCGTTFGRLFEPPDQGPRVDPGRAAMFSLFFPGAGHIAAGHPAEGIARAIVFLFALATGLLALFANLRGGGPGLFTVVMVLGLGAAAALYVLSTLDAGRVAQGTSPIVSTRILLYGAVGLMLATLTLVTIAATGASPGG